MPVPSGIFETANAKQHISVRESILVPTRLFSAFSDIREDGEGAR
jgi:hypothetical protein